MEDKKSVVEVAKERFQYAEESYATSYNQAVADMRFVFGDSDNGWQWPEDVMNGRKGDAKVCLTVNLTAQHCNQIINQIRQNRPTGKVLPVDDDADKKTAEILEGLIRNIQSSSCADSAHDTAAEQSVYGGFGYWRVTTEYESPDSFNQVIKINPIQNFKLVYIDPDAVELDKSDAEWGFVFEDVKKETFKRQYPKHKDAADFVTPNSYWANKETIRVAEYFWCEYLKDKALLLQDGSTMLESDLQEGFVRSGNIITAPTGEVISILKERDTERKKWKWCKIAGNIDEPIDEQDWAGSYLPIISVVGKEANIDGEKIVKGIVRDLKDSARTVNYAYSETVQTLALQNKIPYMAAAEATDGHEQYWKSANIDNLGYLPYNAYDDTGRPLPVPQRQAPPTMPSAQVQLLQLSTEEMRGASGQQNANFGIRSEASSGVGIQRLKAQGEIATFHFPDNLARGLRYECKVLIDLIQKIYDTRRVVRILGLDGKLSQAVLDPEAPAPYIEHEIGEEDIQRIFNPTVGRYDVVIDTGPSFQTQRQEAFALLTDLSSRNPQLMGMAGDIIMRNSDIPGGDKIADRLAKSLPPELREEKKGSAEQQLALITQQAQQMSQQIEMMTMQLQDQQMKLQQAESEDLKAQIGFEMQRQKAELDAAMKEQQMIQENELKQRQMMFDAELQREKMLHEHQIARERMELEAQLAREKAEFEASMTIYKTEADAEKAKDLAKIKAGTDIAAGMMKSHQETCAQVKMNEDNNDVQRDKAELDAYVKLEIAGMQNQALATDVNMDLQEDIKDDMKED